MTAMITASVIGVAGAAYAANKSASATNNAVRTQKQLANDQQELAEDRFDWEKSVYENDTKPMQEADAELRRRLIESNLEDAETQRAFAKDQKDFYEKVFKPNEQRVAEEAANFDSAENVARRSGIAAANVNQQFANANAQRARQLGRYGLNPNSSVFSAQTEGSARAQALASAGAQTGAAFDTKDKAISLRAGVANFGRNMPNTAAGYFTAAGASGAQAGNQSSAGLTNQINSMQPMQSAYGSYVNGLQMAGNNLIGAYQNEASMWNGIGQGFASLGSAVAGLGSSGTSYTAPNFFTGAYSNPAGSTYDYRGSGAVDIPRGWT